MPKPYGVILTNTTTRVTRAIVQGDGKILVQTLKVTDNVLLTQAELYAMPALLGLEAEGDPVLRELRYLEADGLIERR